jgi:hypothetical protein
MELDGTKTEQKRNKNGTKTEQKRNKNGTKTEQKRNKNGTKTEQKRNKNGSNPGTSCGTRKKTNFTIFGFPRNNCGTKSSELITK